MTHSYRQTNTVQAIALLPLWNVALLERNQSAIMIKLSHTQFDAGDFYCLLPFKGGFARRLLSGASVWDNQSRP